MRDTTSFNERFQRWKKTGELPYEAGRIKNADSNREELVYEDSLSLSALPAYEGGKDGTILNYGEVYESSRPLPTPVRKPGDMYDYQRAAELGYKRDTTGHFSTRDYQTGRYLKNPTHPTIMMSVVSDLGEGYYPYYNKKDGLIYSDTWMKMPEYSNGKDGTILNHDYANDVFTGARLFDGLDIVVTGHRRPKPFKWVSPKGVGNMTVMPGDPEMVFFAPIAAGAGIAASPALSGLISNVATPGSAFWTSPITKQLMVGTAAAEGVNKATKAVTGYNSVGEGVGASIEKATGWNPNSTLVGQLATEAFNPGWYLSPNAVLNTAGKVGDTVENLPNLAKNVADKLGFFVQKPGTFTRGIGFGEEGLQDLITTGVVRGNPRGTEATAKLFTKLFNRNRDHFRDIMKSTGIKGIESKWQSRTLTEQEFNAIKEASKLYSTKRMINDNGTMTIKEVSADPLSDYTTYSDYVSTIADDVARVNLMPGRIASGEVKVNTSLIRGEDGILRGAPISERFGPNSDYIEDGTPLSYWYTDGRNPITRGYDYAGSKYGVRVNNPEDYIPFMHNLHLHQSFLRSPRLEDPNVEIFKKGLFGITRRVDKEKLLQGAALQRPLAALDFSDPSGRNIIEEMWYSPVLGKSKAQLLQETTPIDFNPDDMAAALINQNTRNRIGKYLDQIVDKPTPQEVIDIFNNSVLPRVQFMRPGYRGGLMYPTVKSKVDHVLSEGYTVYPKELFEKARGNDTTVGLHYPETGHIGIKEGYEDFAGGHEFRHRLDKFLTKTDTESDILEAAYDDDFLKLSSLYDYLKDVRMGPEAVTTNFDARNAAIGKYHAANTDWKLLNKIIDKLSDEKIIEAVEKSNGYGRAYIDYLRKNNKLTPTKIYQFREAMKWVGMFAGAAPLLNPSKQK